MFNIVPLKNPGVLAGTIPVNIYNSLMDEIREIEINGSPDKFNENLAGIIEEEYQLKKSVDSLIPFLLEMSKEYSKLFVYPEVNRVAEVWVNFQQKNEYNPLHNHRGDLSFVSWMKIPYKISDEYQMENVKNSNSKLRASSFEFAYTTITGEMQVQSIPVEEGWEGRIIMFPSKLSHQVYPFKTSDGYRVSISGNLYFLKN